MQSWQGITKEGKMPKDKQSSIPTTKQEWEWKEITVLEQQRNGSQINA